MMTPFSKTRSFFNDAFFKVTSLTGHHLPHDGLLGVVADEGVLALLVPFADRLELRYHFHLVLIGRPRN